MSTQSYPTRTVLEGVPRIQFYEGGKRCPEDICFPSALRAWLEYMNDPDYGCKHCIARTPTCKVNCTYSFLIGVSGIAAFCSWGPGWQQDNMALHYMSDDPDAPYRRAFEAVGYSVEWLGKTPGRDNETAWRTHIVESIRQGRPVLGFGVVGPPEPALITGYDEGGDVLLGWSFFQNMPEFKEGVTYEPCGYFRKHDWFKATDNLVVIGAKQGQPDMTKACREGLQWMLKVARTPMTYGYRPNGLAAYDAWAADIVKDADVPAGDEATLRARFGVHNNAVGEVAEARWYGAQFLLQCVDFLHYNMTEDLMHAAACYAGEHELMWKAWDLLGGNGNPEGYKYLLDASARRQLAEVIKQSREKYAQAAHYLEHALAK